MKKILILVSIFILIALIWQVPAPDGLNDKAWHIVAVYIGLLVGLVLKPYSEPVITLIIMGLAATVLPADTLLRGYGSDMTWFIAVATMVCVAFVKTGLGRRIAYNLLLRSGGSTLGVGYLMMLTDLLLSPATGSNTARTTIIYPISRQIAESVGSTPTHEPRKLGAYFTILTYVVSQGTAALFLTGMATNAITINLMADMLNLHISWGLWLLASIIPGGLYLLISPYVVYKLYPPQLKSLHAIKPLAAKGLAEMGPMSHKEKILLTFFILAILGWMFGPYVPFVQLSMQTVGFVFLGLILIAEILTWDDIIGAKGAWSIFLWYGAFYGLSASLSSAGFYKWLANLLGSIMNFDGLSELMIVAILLFASLVVRYFFVSNTAFVVSFYPVVFALTVHTGVNTFVIGMLLAFFASYGALLTHYGNGAGLVVYASGYAPQKDFWRVGTSMVFVALAIFFGIGLPYWKLLGLW